MPDHDEITGLLHRYAERVDQGDFVGVGALFAAATYRTDGVEGTLTGAEVGEVLHRTVRIYDGSPRTKHVISNAIVEVDADDDGATGGTARSRSYFSVIQDPPGIPPTIVVTGRYHDRFERVEGRWRFSDRLIFIDQVGDLSAHLHLDRVEW